MNQFSFKKINWNIILVMLIYAFITVTHIAMLQSFRSDNFSINHPSNSIFKRKEVSSTSSSLILRRMEKVVIEDKTINFSAVILFVSTSFLFILSFFDALKRKRVLFFTDSHTLFSNQYAYLTLCTFRI